MLLQNSEINIKFTERSELIHLVLSNQCMKIVKLLIAIALYFLLLPISLYGSSIFHV